MYISDLHCDTVYRISEEGLYRIEASHLDIERMKRAGYGLQTFAAFIDIGRTAEPWEHCLQLLEKLRTETKRNSDHISPVLCGGDIEKNRCDGKISVLYSVEEGGVIGDELDRVSELHSLGVRMMTLTWNHKNTLASPAFDCDSTNAMTADGDMGEGLSPLGFDFVAEAEAHRIILDVSHLSDRGFYDIAGAAKRPFIASHSNSRAVCPVKRNLADDMIRIIGDRGGLIGLNFCADFVGGEGGFEDLARHARRIADIGGVECLALGSDFDGIEYNPLIPDCASTPIFCDHLDRVGFTDAQIDLIMGENAARFLTENL